MKFHSTILPLLAALGALALASPAASQGGPETGADELDAKSLKDLSIEQLMDLEVTIASRSSESISNIPGAVYVLTGDEIRRAGHSSIPEALRMVPGFYVSHWTSAAWDVTSRGFSPGLSLTSSAFLNQLLVMIDGVVVYTPLFAGVWWELQDIDLDDVDRIEVMRGPGGSLWGTNATHGVVNVITKSAASTQGARVSLRTANDDDQVAARYGGKLGESGSYRVWAKGAWYDTLQNSNLGFDNDWYSASAGFRADWQAGGQLFNVNSRFYETESHAYQFDGTGNTVPGVDTRKGYQLFASMTDPEKSSTLQAWFSTDQQAQPTFTDFTIDTFDVDYHREFAPSEGNRLTVGTGYRRVNSEIVGDDPTFFDFDPQVFHQDIFRGYVLDKVALPSWSSELTLGVTLEHNDFTEFEVQPTLRYTWNGAENVALWAAISRAVRTPSLEENSLSSGSFFVGSTSFRSEELMAYEAGARALLSQYASMDLALFFNDYDNLHFEQDNGGGQFLLTNDAEGTSYGAELALDAKPTPRWTLRSAYSFVKGDYQNKNDGSDIGNEDYYPAHQINLRSYYDLGENWELDSALYVVKGMGPNFEIAEYYRADVRVGWHPSEKLEIYVGVQQLNEGLHSEYDEFNQVRRSAVVGMRWMPGSF